MPSVANSKDSVHRIGNDAEFSAPTSFYEPTERIENIKAELLASPYSICLERPVLLDKFWHSRDYSPHDHYLVKRAKALAYVFSHRKPRIYNHELIIGNMTSKRIAANYYPEGGSINILEDIFRLEKRAVPLHLSPREKLHLFYLGIRNLKRSVGWEAFLKHPGRISYLINNTFLAQRYFVTEVAGISHQAGNYWNIVHHGLRRADEIARTCLETKKLIDGTPLNDDQIAFYNAIRITIDGICKMAANLADEAERLAALPETSPERSKELQELAGICRHVPYNPARTFWEGLQSCWLMHIIMNLEDYEQGLSWGRLDQILYPLYLRDIEEGRLNPEKAVELIASFQLKCCETMPLFSKRIDQFFSGNTVGQGITLGGTDVEGHDVTNELSALFLDAYAQILTREPNIHVRIHEHTPDWLLEKAVEVLQMGNGSPALFGDKAIVRALENAGMTREHARDYAVIGCVELGSQGRTYNSSDAALFNLPLCLELALNRGRKFSSGFLPGKRLGPVTPPVSAMKTFDDVVKAYREQVASVVDEAVKVIGWLENAYRKIRTSPVNSIMTEGCLEKGYDITSGSARYDFTSLQIVGLADVADSLYAIKKLVYEDKRLTLEEFTQILKNNYKGHEVLRTEIISRFPHYGNGNPEVDYMMQVAVDAFTDAVTAHRNTRGGQYLVGVYSMTCNVPFGKATGAMPNGRLAGQVLSNGLSSSNGADRTGPTAALRSAAFVDNLNFGNCLALNIKFDKKVVANRAGKKAVAALFRSYLVDQGGMQVQVNMIDSDLLRKAKENPAAYPGLLVRVAGYCAYFKDLPPDVQDEIIARTEYGG
ncbi:pyruvate formate lyase family protein [Thermosyntropha sp.]|uniref:pyruvate formate lyase family protein n=1 Tax=Thermosyntropha sp. TaxID=2740820 RepID=UPI0025F4B708|nr:pyruvate formate lyase family protein [Thermosyntropha sp.]MBO8157956.1 hypothetical protein [Thermosyntropha sp.]